MNIRVQKPLEAALQELNLGKVERVHAAPKWKPTQDQLPLAYDIDNKTLWIYTDGAWVSLLYPSMSSLNPLDLENVDPKKVGNIIRLPVAYKLGNQIVEGYITLEDLKEKLNQIG